MKSINDKDKMDVCLASDDASGVMDVRRFLLDYAVKREVPEECVIETFLGDCYALTKRHQTLSSTLDELNCSFALIKESNEYRGRVTDYNLDKIRHKMDKVTADLIYVISKLETRIIKATKLISFLPDPEMKVVLELHYLEGLSLVEIREKGRLYYGRTKTNGLHRAGLMKLHEIMEL